jgi:Asp-tRNA(Asn)/Glu-tRNA(Gln) amidotransferase A subunit family amidase
MPESLRCRFCGAVNGMPVGFQVPGARGNDEVVLRLGSAVEPKAVTA